MEPIKANIKVFGIRVTVTLTEKGFREAFGRALPQRVVSQLVLIISAYQQESRG